jgi:hypothetical protein
MGPEKISNKWKGIEKVRSLGGLWIQAESEMGGTECPGITQMTLGFDPKKGRFVGTFVGSMMTHLWVYDNGRLDEAERVLTLEAEGPAMDDPEKIVTYRDLIGLVSNDERTLTSQTQDAEGNWKGFMTVRYRRVAA